MARRAVLIGCNYPGTDAALNGCANDVMRMKGCLISRYGFNEEDITLLLDSDDSYVQPTGKNICEALMHMLSLAEPGDTLVIHYSGHGTRIPVHESGDHDDETGFDECIFPCDGNIITDDDFRTYVNQLPEGCRLTIISDSCHSGGLIEETKEQIGESTMRRRGQEEEVVVEEGKEEEVVDEHVDEGEEVVKVEGQLPEGIQVKSRSLSLSGLVNFLKRITGNDDINAGNIRSTLFDTFGEDATPKVKKFAKLMMNKLKKNGEAEPESTAAGSGFFGIVGLAQQQFLKMNLDNNAVDTEVEKLDNDPAILDDTEVVESNEGQVYAGSDEEVYEGLSVAVRELPDGGILISGCQTHQTSADCTPDGDVTQSYGALSMAILNVVEESDGPISNQELVMRVRELLSGCEYTQSPGLYCSDHLLEAPFLC